MKQDSSMIGKSLAHGGFMNDQLLYLLAEHVVVEPLIDQWKVALYQRI